MFLYRLGALQMRLRLYPESVVIRPQWLTVLFRGALFFGKC